MNNSSEYKKFNKILLLVALMWLILECIVTHMLFSHNFIIWIIISIILSLSLLAALLFIICIIKLRGINSSSIKIMRIEFNSIEECMNKLDRDIFQTLEYLEAFVYNPNDECYYQLYKKDEIHWMRNIGKENPIERYR